MEDKICLRSFTKNELKLLKVFLICKLHKLFSEMSFVQINLNWSEGKTECYEMDSKILRSLICHVVETGEYTLEGIALYTRIPFDVILDAACGNNVHLSMTAWVRIVDMYMQVRPEISQFLFNKLLELENKNQQTISSILSEPS